MNINDLFENVIDASARFKQRNTATSSQKEVGKARQKRVEEHIQQELTDIREKYINKTLKMRMMVRPLFRRYGRDVEFFDVLYLALTDRNELALRFFSIHKDEIINIVEQYLDDLNNLESTMKKMKVSNPDLLADVTGIRFRIFHLERHLENLSRDEW